MSGHEEYRQWSAAYVLGALDPDERHAFEEHLSRCAECQDEVRTFAPIPGLLAKIETPEPVVVPADIEEAALRTVRAEWTRLKRSRRRWRTIAIAAATAAVLALGGMLSGMRPTAGTKLVFAQGSLASGEIVVEQRPWGTEVVLELEGLPPAESYTAWAVDAAGKWYPVAAWGPTPQLSASVIGASSLDVSELDRVVVTTGEKDQMILEAWPEDS